VLPQLRPCDAISPTWNLVSPKPSGGTQAMLANRITIAAFGVLAVASNLVFAADPPADPPPEKGVRLMGMLSEWQYPDTKFHGAEMSDAAVRGIDAIKCKAVLTTPDAFEKVLAFYLQKLNVDATGKNLGAKAAERVTTNRAVSIQDNSEGRPLKLYIIAIDEADTSTTLVLSRSEGEQVTNIAWSNYRQLTP
jgi:hypothetical protein